MTTQRWNKPETMVYAVLWGLLFLAPVLSIYIRSTQDDALRFDWGEVLYVWRQYVVYLVIFLIHNALLAPLLVVRQRRLLYFSAITVLVAAFFTVQCVSRPGLPEHEQAFHALPPERPADFGETPPPPPPHDGQRHDPASQPHDPASQPYGPEHGDMPHSYDNEPPFAVGQHDVIATIVLILMLGMNLGVKLYFRQRRTQRQMALMEKQSLERQLQFLRYQINPHFLMNTLNNIHALIDIDPEKAQQTVVGLSKIMRFVLYEGDRQKVALSRELAFMQEYIELMRIRVTDRVAITVSLPEELPEREVPPLVLITFVENAFKHGISYQQPSYIDISVRIVDERLHFACTNSKLPHVEKAATGGVGLQNVRQRLELIYGDQFSLDITDGDSSYAVSLVLPLSAPAEALRG